MTTPIPTTNTITTVPTSQDLQTLPSSLTSYNQHKIKSNIFSYFSNYSLILMNFPQTKIHIHWKNLNPIFEKLFQTKKHNVQNHDSPQQEQNKTNNKNINL